MDDWTEEDQHPFERGPGERRVLDQWMIREPIRTLYPRPPLTLPPTATVADAVQVMREHRVGCVLITESERLVGIMTERDLLLKLDRADSGRPLRELMTPDPETLRLEDPIFYILNKMSVGGFRHVPLVDAEGRPVGVVSVKDVVDYIVDFFAKDVLTVPPDTERGQAWRGRDGA